MEFPEGLVFERYAPASALADYVEHFWMVRAPGHNPPRREILIPNGRPTIVLCLDTPGRRIGVFDDVTVPNTSTIAGISTRPIVLEQFGPSLYLGAQLQPWGLKAFGVPHLANSVIPLGNWMGRDAAEALEARTREAGVGPEAAAMFGAVLKERLRAIAGDRVDLLKRAFAIMESAESLIEVDDLTRRLEIGYDALYRLFRTDLGLSPKPMLSIMRFYRFSGQLLNGQHDSRAILACMQGYFDQAHAAREFKRYTGIAQREFETALNGIARLMHRQGHP